MLGVAVFARRLDARPPFAAIGALSFGLGTTCSITPTWGISITSTQWG
jgi:hypothetical protein